MDVVERHPSGSRPGALTALGWALIVAAVLIMGGALAFYFTRPQGLPATEPTSYRYATEIFTNERGGYTFRYPPRWRVDPVGSSTVAISPRRDVTVTYGNAPPGDLGASASRIVQQLGDNYRRPTLRAAEVKNIGGSFAAVIAGSATNIQGVPVRFLVISIAGEQENYGITVFAARASDPEEVLPPVQEMVASFQPV